MVINNSVPFSTVFAKGTLYNDVERSSVMITDVTGIVLMPGNRGVDCLGNGVHPEIECCCDACDYMQCCLAEGVENCMDCRDLECPRRSF